MCVWFSRLCQTVRKVPFKYCVYEAQFQKRTQDSLFKNTYKSPFVRKNMHEYSREGGAVLGKIRPRERYCQKCSTDPLDLELEDELNNFKIYLEKNHKDKIPLEDLEYNFATGNAKLCDGYLTGLSSMEIVETYVYRNGKNDEILSEFHMKNLMANFNKFSAQHSGRSFSGGVEIKVPDNRVYISYEKQTLRGKKSVFRLSNNIVAAKLGNIEVAVVGSLLFNRMVANKLTPVLNTRKETTAELLEKSISSLLAEYKRTWTKRN